MTFGNGITLVNENNMYEFCQSSECKIRNLEKELKIEREKMEKTKKCQGIGDSLLKELK